MHGSVSGGQVPKIAIDRSAPKAATGEHPLYLSLLGLEVIPKFISGGVQRGSTPSDGGFGGVPQTFSFPPSPAREGGKRDEVSVSHSTRHAHPAGEAGHSGIAILGLVQVIDNPYSGSIISYEGRKLPEGRRLTWSRSESWNVTGTFLV